MNAKNNFKKLTSLKNEVLDVISVFTLRLQKKMKALKF